MRKTMVRTMDADTSRFCDVPLADLLTYFKEVQLTHPTACFEHNWTGYEDMTPRFYWFEDETDEEMNYRIRREEYEKQRIAKEEQERQRKEEYAKRLAALQKEFKV